MILLSDIKVSAHLDESNRRVKIEQAIEKQLSRSKTVQKPYQWQILKQSIDARKHDQIRWVYQIGILEKQDTNPSFAFSMIKKQGILSSSFKRPVIIGSGPCGYFAGLLLAFAGAKPIILEQGEAVESRQSSVNAYWTDGDAALNEWSNVQFGEGGAGTFSDGKLNTGTKSPWHRLILEIFVQYGAPAEILIQQKPHIGTDYLANILPCMRSDFEQMGGTILFKHRLESLLLDNQQGQSVLRGVRIYDIEHNAIKVISCESVILAPGHSSRDLMRTLFVQGLHMEAKTFAVGVRIEHPQSYINQLIYGLEYEKQYVDLPVAAYKTAIHVDDHRTLFTFCMCPGGLVVASSSQRGHVVTNGMSRFLRAEKHANSALLVNVYPSDLNSKDAPLKGFDFQDQIEQLAFQEGGQNGCAPAQLTVDFIHDRLSKPKDLSHATYRPGVRPADLKCVLPPFICENLKKGLIQLEQKWPGFIGQQSILTAVESRSSSPVTIVRDRKTYESNIKGLYPAGEGAGYAGGIMSAANDGLKVAASLLKRWGLEIIFNDNHTSAN